MVFSSIQKSVIKKDFEKRFDTGSKYNLVYKENSEYKTTWSLTDNPTWDWNTYEYRLLKILDKPLDKSEVEDIFVYVYKGMVYYNDPNNELHVGYVNGMNENSAFTTAMPVMENLQIFNGKMIVGGSVNKDTVLRIKGITNYNSDIQTSWVGPSLLFKSVSNEVNNITFTFSDMLSNPDTGLVIDHKPQLKIDSLTKKERIIIRNKQVDRLNVSTQKASILKNNKGIVKSLVANISFTDIQQICRLFFPIGCFYWTSNGNFNPATQFGGKWERVQNTFMYATGFSDKTVTTAQHGESTHTLTLQELGMHTHSITDSGHSHDSSQFTDSAFGVDINLTVTSDKVVSNLYNKQVMYRWKLVVNKQPKIYNYNTNGHITINIYDSNGHLVNTSSYTTNSDNYSNEGVFKVSNYRINGNDYDYSFDSKKYVFYVQLISTEKSNNIGVENKQIIYSPVQFPLVQDNRTYSVSNAFTYSHICQGWPVESGAHTHTISDSGHEHDFVTRGDDYNGSFCSDQHNTANFVGDGWNTLTYQNRQHGAYCSLNRTGVSINTGLTNISIDNTKSNLSLNNFNGGGLSHNNMPPYLAAFCWHRIG